ncbi:MAG TPA: hypothetical protein VGF30_15100 [Bacteroidia bacterium]
MKRGIYILFVLFVFVIDAQSQIVPGYQGKRTFVNYQLNIGPAFRRPTFLNMVSPTSKGSYPSGTAEEAIFFSFNTTHSLNIERVMGRKFAMSFSYSLAASKDYFTFSQDIADGASGQTTTYVFRNKQLNVFGHYYQGGLIFYGRNALAPFGKYFKLNMGYCSMMGKFTDDELVSETKSPYTDVQAKLDTKNAYYKTHSFGWGFSFGMNRIFYNKLVINRGISFFLPTKPDDFIKSSPDISLKNITTTVVKRLQPRDLATFYIGCGYLF